MQSAYQTLSAKSNNEIAKKAEKKWNCKMKTISQEQGFTEKELRA